MTADTIMEFFRERGLEYDPCLNDQVRVKTCPFCDADGYHLYVLTSEKVTMDGKKYSPGCYDCKKCGARGGWKKLLEQLGGSVIPVKNLTPDNKFTGLDKDLVETYKKNLLKYPEAVKYLEGRGINKKSIQHFELGCDKTDDGLWITFPSFCDDVLCEIQYKLILSDKKKYRRTGQGKAVLYNQNAITNEKEVVIAEGEIDCITLWQNGIKNVCAVLGAENFPAYAYEFMQKKDKIYLCFDNDYDKERNVGQDAAKKLSDRLGLSKCYNILLPLVDINDYFVKYNMGDFYELMEQASTFNIESICSIADVINKFSLEEENVQGYSSGWENVDKLARMFRPGGVTVVSAIVKTGKTTFCLNMALHNAKQGIPVLFYCLEMTPEELYRKLIACELEIEDNDFKDITEDMVKKAGETLKSIPLYFGYNYTMSSYDKMIDLLRESVKKYGIKILIFDNINSLNIDVKHKVEQMDLLSKSFKSLVMETKIHLFLVAQFGKIKGDERMPTIQDVRGSSLIAADADNVMILFRKRKESDIESSEEEFQELKYSLEPFTVVRMEAGRSSAGGDTALYFCGAKSKFYRLTDKNKEEEVPF